MDGISINSSVAILVVGIGTLVYIERDLSAAMYADVSSVDEFEDAMMLVLNTGFGTKIFNRNMTTITTSFLRKLQRNSKFA